MASRLRGNKIDTIFIHCAATRPSMDIGDAEIDSWHKARGWSEIGYHVVIRRSGEVEYGRSLDEVGAQVAGHNSHSLGVCMVGGIAEDGRTPENNFTSAQWESLHRVCTALRILFPNTTFKGHREVDAGKACPSFDVQEWARVHGFQ